MITVNLESQFKIDKSNIIKIAKKIRKHFGEHVLPKDQGIATYRFSKDLHRYEFIFHSDITETDSEKLASIFYYVIPHDFELEIDIDIPEEHLTEVEEYEELSESTKHELWMQCKISEGWRYGMCFSSTDKTDPCLRPFYQLTSKQLKEVRSRV